MDVDGLWCVVWVVGWAVGGGLWAAVVVVWPQRWWCVGVSVVRVVTCGDL